VVFTVRLAPSLIAGLRERARSDSPNSACNLRTPSAGENSTNNSIARLTRVAYSSA
jgi:hypothetical protein